MLILITCDILLFTGFILDNVEPFFTILVDGISSWSLSLVLFLLDDILFNDTLLLDDVCGCVCVLVGGDNGLRLGVKEEQMEAEEEEGEGGNGVVLVVLATVAVVGIVAALVAVVILLPLLLLLLVWLLLLSCIGCIAAASMT